MSRPGTRSTARWRRTDFRRNRPNTDAPAPVTAPGRSLCAAGRNARGVFVVSGGGDAYNLEERKAGKEISAVVHADVHGSWEMKDMVDGSAHA